MKDVVIVDNGAGQIKYGFHSKEIPQGTMSNCVANAHKQMHVFVGDQVDDTIDGSALQYTRPFEKGYLTKWGCQLDIWSRLFGKSCMNISNFAEHSLVITEPPFNLESIRNDINEIIFEEYGFSSFLRRMPAWFSAYEFLTTNDEELSSCTIVDSGYSFTHSIPFVDLKCKKEACRRVNIGGKLLTNYLKELVSFRQWNMMDEFKLINQVKESLCYVSMNAARDLRNCKSSGIFASDPFGGKLRQQFVLPDYSTVMKGFVKPEDQEPDPSQQLLLMETERFAVPELLFSPGDINVGQAGVAEATWQGLRYLDEVEQGLVTSHVVLTGGNTNLKQFHERFEVEFRPLVPDIFPVQIYSPPSPETYAWRGAARFVRDSIKKYGMQGLQRQMVSKQEYLEYGNDYCNRKLCADQYHT